MIWRWFLLKKKDFSIQDAINFTCFASLIYIFVNVFFLFPYPERYIATQYDKLNYKEGEIRKDEIKKRFYSRFGVRQTEILTIDDGIGINQYSCSIYYSKACYVNKYKLQLSRDIYDVSVIIRWAEHFGRRVIYELTINNKKEVSYEFAIEKYTKEYLVRMQEFNYHLRQSIICLFVFVVTLFFGIKNESNH